MLCCLTLGALAVMLSVSLFAVWRFTEAAAEPSARVLQETRCLNYYDFVLDRASDGMSAADIRTLVAQTVEQDAAEPSLVRICGDPERVLTTTAEPPP